MRNGRKTYLSLKRSRWTEAEPLFSSNWASDWIKELGAFFFQEEKKKASSVSAFFFLCYETFMGYMCTIESLMGLVHVQ